MNGNTYQYQNGEQGNRYINTELKQIEQGIKTAINKNQDFN